MRLLVYDNWIWFRYIIFCSVVYTQQNNTACTNGLLAPSQKGQCITNFFQLFRTLLIYYVEYVVIAIFIAHIPRSTYTLRIGQVQNGRLYTGP